MSEREQRQNLVIVGSVAFDSVETPDGAVEKALGGSASYASLAASYFCSPQIVAVVGDDFGERHVENFRSRGIDTTGIERVEGRTFHWKGRYHANFQDRDTIETQLNVFEGFDPVLPRDYRKTPYVFLGNIGPGLQAKVLDQVESPRLIGMDTMNYWIESAADDLRRVLERVDILFINDEEALQLSEERQVLKAAEKVLSLGPKFLVIKRGEFGSLLFGENICLFVPAVLLPKVVDPTGAGDAFAGGFLGSIARAGDVGRRSLSEALIAGTVMASFAVEKFSVDGLLDLSPGGIDIRRSVLEDMTTYL